MVEEIGRIKHELSLPIYEPKREDQVFHNVTTANQGPLSAEAVKRVFERIIDEMRSIQKTRKCCVTGDAPLTQNPIPQPRTNS